MSLCVITQIKLFTVLGIRHYLLQERQFVLKANIKVKGSYDFLLRGLRKRGHILAVGAISQIVIEPILIALRQHCISLNHVRQKKYFLDARR
jgi:hypothetical protein